ncbi:PilN domain-containing protein [Clostridium sp.]|uniref:PilN domain-containing protein n=1 Tax=Clostridium sp. TaxID=1506 RepID=UPI001A44A981|nr:PilN domain-containing protein [Clostridium sp.]MBK5240155.1 PilN domain-containing protein [Clostridium sp.]
MKDFNFFSQYSGSRKDFKKEYLYAVVLSMGLILFISFTYAFNYFKISKLNSEIVDIQQNLNSKENIVKLKEIEDEEKKLALMNQYHDIVVNISDDINSKDIIGSQLMDEINSCVPGGVYFKDITLDASGMQLKAEGKDRESVAVFERALRNLDSIKEVHVSIIDSSSTENKNLTFSIYCTLKDGDNNEGN